MGLNIFAENKSNNNNQTLMILTDGEANEHPKGGEKKALKKWVQKHQYCPTINSYSFGKNIDSIMLQDFANIGNGSFSFIPCPGFVGTIFVHSISNIFSTMGSNTKLRIEPINGVKIAKVLGNL